MIAVNTFPNKARLAGDTWSTPSQGPGLEAAESRYSFAQQTIDELILGIEPLNLRDLMGRIFNDLLRLLECLSLLESRLSNVNEAKESFAVFQLIEHETSELVQFVRTRALASDAMPEPLAETLDGITFAINHDLRRLFEGDDDLRIDTAADHVVIGKLCRAHDVMSNCLQQSVITLAILFDPELIGTRFFSNSDIRLRQSIRLCEDLSTLIEYLANHENGEEQTGTQLFVAIDFFRKESMRFLMYSDWPQIESFCERLMSAKARQEDLLTVLHRFRCYLETLLAQVKMRTVLADAVSPYLKETRSPQESTAFGKDFSSPIVSDNVQDLECSWETMAVAS